MTKTLNLIIAVMFLASSALGRSAQRDFDLLKLERTRRVGLFDDRPVRIYGGARVVGRLGGWDVGFLASASIRPRERTSTSSITKA